MANGKAGAPPTNDNAARGNRLKHAIDEALAIKSKALGQCALIAIWGKQIDDALESEAASDRRAAAALIAERYAGKAVQAIEATVAMTHEAALRELEGGDDGGLSGGVGAAAIAVAAGAPDGEREVD